MWRLSPAATVALLATLLAVGAPAHSDAQDNALASPLRQAAMPSSLLPSPQDAPIDRLPPLASPFDAVHTTDSPDPLGSPRPGAAPVDWKKLMRPRFSVSGDWSPVTDGLGVRSVDASVRVPTYPFFGPPPPFLSVSYSFTELDAERGGDVGPLHDVALGVAWIRKINTRWTARFTLAAALATDLDNWTNDAWQLRAGAFALYKPNEQWSWAFGAIATGRDDLPVLPGIGAIWTPNDTLRVELMMPKPRIAFLAADRGDRQHWLYVGMAIEGGTWAIRRGTAGGRNDRLNYREFRAMAGWESSPRRPRGSFMPSGKVYQIEAGIAFGREIEFQREADLAFDPAVTIRTSARF